MTETWTELAKAEDVARLACERILQQAESAIAERGVFRLVLAGGGTPRMTYELLANENADWKNWAFYFGDERCHGVGHADLNSTMARQSLLDRVSLDPRKVFPIPTYLGAEQAAKAYLHTIKQALPFDLVLLGMGEDGHTASIFPGHAWQDMPPVYPVYDAPKPPPDRVTLSAEVLGTTRYLLYLVTGSGKSDAFARWHAGESLPIASVSGAVQSEILYDRQAGMAV